MFVLDQPDDAEPIIFSHEVVMQLVVFLGAFAAIALLVWGMLLWTEYHNRLTRNDVAPVGGER